MQGIFKIIFSLWDDLISLILQMLTIVNVSSDAD